MNKLSNQKNVTEFNEISQKLNSTAALFRKTEANLDEFFTSLIGSKSTQVSRMNSFSGTLDKYSNKLSNNQGKSLSKSQGKNSSLTATEIRELDTNSNFFSQNRTFLVRIFKFYCNLSDCTNLIYMNFNSFARLMNDCGVLENIEKEKQNAYDFPFKLRVFSLSRKTPSNKQSQNKSFGFSEINALFSKFSSEYDGKLDDSLTRSMNDKTNFNFYTSNYNQFKLNKMEKDKTKSFSNRKINFHEFIKIIICLSQKIYRTYSTMDSCSISNDPQVVTPTLEKFINEYLMKIYKEIEFIFIHEEQDFVLLHELLVDDHIVIIQLKLAIPIEQVQSNAPESLRFLYKIKRLYVF
jgi:hypothetical protein